LSLLRLPFIGSHGCPPFAINCAVCSMDHIVATTVFLKDVNDFGRMNAVYATFFKNAPPARATVEVARLPRDAKIEISAIAMVP
jgi:2-iminobutanoate/2-iminopropanoate deaminase